MGFLNTAKINKCRKFSDIMSNTKFSIKDTKGNNLKDDIQIVLKNGYRILKHLGKTGNI